MKPWRVVWMKELRDAGRDRRALLSLFLFPVLGPLLVWFMFNMIIDLGEEVQDVELPVAGAEHAPELVDFLRQNGIALKLLELEVPADGSFGGALDTALEAAIAAREYDFALVVPAGFQGQVAAAKTVSVELHYDSSRTSANVKVARVAALLDAWSRETAALRLVARGFDPALLRPLNVGRIDVASSQARAQAVLSMIPMFVIMAAFMSGVGIAVDTTAGERERKSLEPLLVNPVRRSQLVLGKWLAAVVFSVTGLVLVMALNLLALSQVPLEELGFSFSVGVAEITGILLVTVPLAFFATALQIFTGIFARSFKDAQIYISLMSLLPMLPYFYNIMNTSGRELWMSFVPMLGQNMLLADVVSGRTPAFFDLLLAALTLLLWSGVLVACSTRLLKRERIIFV